MTANSSNGSAAIQSADTQTQSPLLLISGPTACGKSGLSIALAKELNAEIVNIDSVQVYREVDIGSAKISLAEREGVPHHLLDIFEADDRCDAGRFCDAARQAIAQISQRSKLPLLVGGSTMYVTSLFHGLASLPACNSELREELKNLNSEELYQKLAQLDAKSAEKIHPNDRVRLIRAIEASIVGKRPASEILGEHNYAQKPYVGLMLILCMQREQLYQRINDRVEQMLKNGLLEETQSLSDKYGKDIQAFRSLGYAESLKCLEQSLPQSALSSEISMHTRQYAKRQMTFWRNEPSKRGWKTSPQQSAGEQPVKAFQTLNLSRNSLISLVKERLLNEFEQNEVWYIDASSLG